MVVNLLRPQLEVTKEDIAFVINAKTGIPVYELLEEGKKATREDIVNILEKAREKKGISHIHFCFSEERP